MYLEKPSIKCDCNRPFPSYLLPLCQNESTCETIHMKMSSPARPFSCESNSFSFDWFRTRARFETEVKGNSEILRVI